MRLVLLGPPGAGKGTQAARLCAGRTLAHLSTGDMLRRAVAAKSALGRKVQSVMARGDLVSDATVIALIAERVEAADCRPGFVLDGFPRTPAQAEALEGLLKEKDMALDAVLELRVEETALLARMKTRLQESGAAARADDTEDALAIRLKVYRRETAPVSDFYAARGLLHALDGMQPIDDVTAAIDEALDRVGK